MRRFIHSAAVACLAAIAFGCASSKAPKSEAQAEAPAREAGSAKVCTLQSHGRDVLQVTVPPNATCTAEEGTIRIESREHDVVDLWLVPGAKTVDEGIDRVGTLIAYEFKALKVATTTPLTVSGAPAKRLTGTGVETDDGDPGSADLIVFKMGDDVFVACTHGESITAAARQQMLTVVQSAKAH